MEDAHVGVLLEEMRANFKVFGEALQDLRSKVEGLDAKVEGLDAKVEGLSTKVEGLQADMTDVKERVTRIEVHLNGAPRRKRRKR